MSVRIHESWKTPLLPAFETDNFKKLTEFVKNAYQTATVYPPPKQIFSAFDACPYDQVKVVILGQDPYHGKGQANGMSFSVAPGVRIPPSLQNIYKEMKADLDIPIPETGDLTHWAKQGVLLINATLTVQDSMAGSHQKKGWEEFTDYVIQTLSKEKDGLVFILWGAYAQKKGEQIDRLKHLVLEAPHPSPLSASRGFFGSKPFSQTNTFLVEQGKEPIIWG